MKKQINPNVKAHLIRSAFYVLLLLAFCVIPFALAQRNTTRRAVNKPKVAANTRHAVTAPTSQFRNDVVTPATKQKIKAPATHFTNASGRVPQSAALRKGRAAPSGLCSYEFTTGADAIVPGDTNTGNFADDGDTLVTLPFSFTLYDQTFNAVNVSSNGRADFVCVNEPGGFAAACLPAPDNVCPFDYTIFPNWSDYRTDIVGEGCANFASGCGIFTSVSGSAPDRIFNIEWRVVYFADHTQTANFELRLYESGPDLRFDFIFGTVQPGSDQLYVSGVQGPGGVFTEDFCDAGPPSAGSRSYTCTGTAPTPTPTATPGGCAVTGSIDPSDPTQIDRLFRSAIPQTCPASTTCAVFGDATPRHYDEYTFTNTTGATQCVTVDTNTACTGTNFIFIAAYLDSFDPDNICTNWIGDSGSSPNPDQPFQFNVDDGQTFVVVVSEVTPEAGCPSYTVTVTPEAICGGGTPTPTPTPGTPTPTPTPGGSCPPVITESTSQEIVDGNSVACNNGVGTTENHYYRAFNMFTFTGGADYLVTSVSFGIELATSGTGTGQPLTVNLYANHGSLFPAGDWQSNLIATSGEINIPDQADTVFNVPLTVTAPGSALELVMEVTTPDGTAVGNLLFVGSNPDPETGLSYLEAADCGVNTPTPTGDIGFPDMHIVFDVNGSCQGGTPTPTPGTPTPTPGTPTPTPGTPTPTPGQRATPTPRPRPTPYPRPTP